MSWQFPLLAAGSFAAARHAIRAMAALCLVALVVHAATHAAHAQSNLSARIMWYGPYTVSTSKEVKDPSSPTGSRFISTPVPPRSNSERVPAKQGVRFGFVYVLSGDGERDVTVKHVFRFPGAGLLDSQTGARTKSDQSVRQDRIGDQVLIGWNFGDSESEQRPTGEWSLEVWAGDRKLAEKHFTIYQP